MRTMCVAVAVLFAVVSPAFAQVRSGAKPSTDQLLASRIPKISFEESPFDQVIDWLADFMKVTIVVRWERLEEVGIERDKPVSINVDDLRFSQVLWMVMNQVGGAEVRMAYRASGNLIILSTEEDLGKEMITKVYDVSDLLVEVPRFTNAPQIDLAQQQQGGGAGGGQQVFSQTGGQGDDEGDQGDDENDEDMQELIDLIVQTVEPDSWQINGAGKGTIHAFRNQIVVRNNILVHQRLEGAISDDE